MRANGVARLGQALAIVGVWAGVAKGEGLQVAKNEDPSVEREGQARNLSDIAFSDETTRNDVVHIWGAPFSYGPAGELEVYALGGGQRLWLTYEEAQPRRLVRAILHRPGSVFGTVLLNNLDVAKHRQRSDIDFSEQRTPQEVYAVWGPPDGVVGSGLQTWIYAMEDGTEVRVTFISGYSLPRVRTRIQEEPECNTDS